MILTSPLAPAAFLAGPNGLLGADDAALRHWRAQAHLPVDRCIDLPLGPAASKQDMMAVFAHGFDLPRWFGHNWDALADCLTDLEWLPEGSLLVLIEGALADADEAHMLCDILEDTCDTWQRLGRPVHMVVDRRLLAHA
jgi:hypothetical protein